MNVTKSFITARIRGGANTVRQPYLTTKNVGEYAVQLSEREFEWAFDAQLEEKQATLRQHYGLPSDADALAVRKAARER